MLLPRVLLCFFLLTCGGFVSQLCLISVTPWSQRRQPGPSISGIFQARILEWVAISY